MKFAAMLIGAALSAILGVAGAEAADVAAGKIVFDKCMQCHRIGVGATNFHGPVLDGPIDRAAGTAPGYKYSEAMEKSGIVWNYQTLPKYPRQPRQEAPGVDMTFAGLKNQDDIDNVIAWISQFRGYGGQD